MDIPDRNNVSKNVTTRNEMLWQRQGNNSDSSDHQCWGELGLWKSMVNVSEHERCWEMGHKLGDSCIRWPFNRGSGFSVVNMAECHWTLRPPSVKTLLKLYWLLMTFREHQLDGLMVREIWEGNRANLCMNPYYIIYLRLQLDPVICLFWLWSKH